MKTITAEEVNAKLVAGEKLHILDVREAEEVQAGHIPEVIHIPLSLLQFKLQELEKKLPYIVVCRSGGRSHQACNLLDSYGYAVTNMLGGMQEWQGEIVQE